jgi:nitroimidazol reductase NimA-like FMN-containing flavoprotein (pyridoxamine 5'-phosphate oxidase superfamily)
MPEFVSDSRSRVRRVPERAAYDQDTIYAIVDEALFCHVGFVQDDQPFVIPTNHARLGDTLFFHGAHASRFIKQVAAGHELCVAMTLVDGLVLARSVCSHSMNYRSAVLFGRGHLVDGEAEKLQALERLTEHLLPGRWADARKPTAQELRTTAVVAMPIDSASAKVRSGLPADDEADYDLPVWAGLVPLQQQFLAPVGDPRLAPDIPVPGYVADAGAGHGSQPESLSNWRPG